MLNIRQFRAEDAAEIVLRKADAADLSGVDMSAYGEFLASASEALSIVTEQGELVACVGGLLISKHNCWVFLLTSELVEDYSLTLVKVLKTFIRRGAKLGVVRFETLVNAADERAVRFIEFLGFEREGLCRATGMNLQDRYMYASIHLPEKHER